MKSYSGLVIERTTNGAYRAVRQKQNFQARSPSHATLQLEGEIPGKPNVLLTVSMDQMRLGARAYETLTNRVLKLFDEMGLAEIDPYRLTMTTAIAQFGDGRRAYLLAVAPVQR